MKTPILIADAGSTKTDWRLIYDNSADPAAFRSEGVNAAIASHEQMTRIFHETADALARFPQPGEIHFYGAGCVGDRNCECVKTALRLSWPEARISVNSDMLATARALLGHRKGIACILGTGSNSALYDGSGIISNVPPLGFILGDEGSGAYIGKRFIADIYRGIAPASITDAFHDVFRLSLPYMISKVYREEKPNAFLASVVPFIHSLMRGGEREAMTDDAGRRYLDDLITDSFRRFFLRNVALYPGVESMPVCFAGSLASVFSPQLAKAAELTGFRIGLIEPHPIERLIRYHRL